MTLAVLNVGRIWLAKSWFWDCADEVELMTMRCRVRPRAAGKWERNKIAHDRLSQFVHQLCSTRCLRTWLLTLIHIAMYVHEHQTHPCFFSASRGPLGEIRIQSTLQSTQIFWALKTQIEPDAWGVFNQKISRSLVPTHFRILVWSKDLC